MVTSTLCMLDEALKYHAQGLVVIPLCWDVDGRCVYGRGAHEVPHKVGKVPLIANWQQLSPQTTDTIRKYWTQYPEANIGLSTNGLVVLDFDVKDAGVDVSLPSIVKQYGLPGTRRVRTGSGGEHWYFKNTSGKPIGNGPLKGYPGIDIKGNGGQVVAPPSLHVNGRRYEVSTGLPIAPAPQKLIDIITSPGTKAYKHEGDIPEGQRHTMLVRTAGKLRSEGQTSPEIGKALKTANKQRCKPSLPDTDIQDIVKQADRWEPGTRGLAKELWDIQNMDMGLSIYQKSVLIYLHSLRIYNKGQAPTVGYKRIAQVCSMVPRMAQNVIYSLRDMGALDIQQDKRPDGHYESNIYHLKSLSDIATQHKDRTAPARDYTKVDRT